MASVWAIGDIHGEYRMLDALLAAVETLRAPDDVTVYLGDFIDFGMESAEVVRRVLAERAARPDHTVLLCGNHEDTAAYFYGLPSPGDADRGNADRKQWVSESFGGGFTLGSFEVRANERLTTPCPPPLAELLTHLRHFYRPALPALANYVFVHAGVPVGVEVEQAPPRELLWIRGGFLDREDPSGRVIVFGHTPREDGSILLTRDKIGIDTGARWGMRLTALQLPEGRVLQADRYGNVSHDRITPP